MQRSFINSLNIITQESSHNPGQQPMNRAHSTVLHSLPNGRLFGLISFHTAPIESINICEKQET